MIVKTEKQANCVDCNKEITLREYEGLEGNWYTDHHCVDPLPDDVGTTQLKD